MKLQPHMMRLVLLTSALAMFLYTCVTIKGMAGGRDSASPLQAPEAELERGPQNLRQIALTFDAGGEANALPDLLRILEREKVTVTFFLTGRWACENLATARVLALQGHEIGNHSWGHKDLTTLEDWEVREEVLRVDDQFVGWFGTRYRPFFRAPFGETNPRILKVLAGLGFRTIRWSIDTLDSIEPRKTASFIEGRVLEKSDEELKGAIVLMHVGYEETVEALPVVIHNLRERGFEIVPISSFIDQDGIQPLTAAPPPKPH